MIALRTFHDLGRHLLFSRQSWRRHGKGGLSQQASLSQQVTTSADVSRCASGKDNAYWLLSIQKGNHNKDSRTLEAAVSLSLNRRSTRGFALPAFEHVAEKNSVIVASILAAVEAAADSSRKLVTFRRSHGPQAHAFSRVQGCMCGARLAD